MAFSCSQTRKDQSNYAHKALPSRTGSCRSFKAMSLRLLSLVSLRPSSAFGWSITAPKSVTRITARAREKLMITSMQRQLLPLLPFDAPRMRQQRSCSGILYSAVSGADDVVANNNGGKEEEDDLSSQKERIALGKEKFEAHFDFPLDDWQYEAGGAICQGHHVLVTAPTGAGKTVVGEMALLYAFYNTNNSSNTDEELSGIYTTPLKALSNQKYTDLGAVFGRSNVGLSTGDVSINKEARIRVMTAEVYRNIAWRSSSSSVSSSSYVVGGRERSLVGTNELASNAVVVLDEFHYMGMPGRGGVWEESVITSPSHTQIVGLSATLPNAAALASWIENVTQRKTILVEVPSRKRPVPLRYLYASKDGLYPLFRDPDAGPGAPKGLLGLRNDEDKDKPPPKKKIKIPRGLQVNPALSSASEKRLQRVNRIMERQKTRQRSNFEDEEGNFGGRGRGRRRGRSDWYSAPRRLSPREEKRERDRLLRNEMRKAVPSLSTLLKRLEQKKMLPSIFFIFSRAGCDNAAQQVYLHMKGPRDPSRLQDDLQDSGEAEKRQAANGKAKRKKARRGTPRRRGDLIEDSDGRAFRPSSNYISEDVLISLVDSSTPLDEVSFDESSPLSPQNWDFYSKAGLLDYKEIIEAASKLSAFNEDNPEIAFEDEIVEQFLFGIGSHHAGMLPAHKSFVELLFRNQLMKVVFATETLAAGINMPARTTVVCALAKRGDSSAMNLLETSNLLQMAGRAGRRGMDTDGTCVIVATPFESQEDAAKILTDPIKPITSQFRPSYSLAVNLIARGEGKLEVARQLIGKSFAMWEKRQLENNIAAAVDSHGEGANTVLLVSAQERFIDSLIETMRMKVVLQRGKLNIDRLKSLIDILCDREQLKKTSKSYTGAIKMLDLEQTTLGYLELEYKTLQNYDFSEETKELLGSAFSEDGEDVLNQITIQQKRTNKAEKDVNKHPFTTITTIANEIMAEKTPEASILVAALKNARSEEEFNSPELTADELTVYAKSAVVIRRKTRKLATANPGLDPVSLIKQVDKAAEMGNDGSWDDLLAITKTLTAYGCLSADIPLDQEDSNEKVTYTITQAGVNIGMLGLDNSLWSVVAMGGAWDVVGASTKLDTFLQALDTLEEDLIDEYGENESGPTASEIPVEMNKSQQEAEHLTNLLRSLSPSELAGYVSSLVTDNSRGGDTSVVDLFQRLTPSQQRVIQSSLDVMERLLEVQKEYSVDESIRGCTLDISNCEAVTAWADGCSWSEALEISGLPPGDLARTLSRVLDALRQFGNLPFMPIRKSDVDGSLSQISRGLHPDVRNLCRDAARAINRYPVKDPLTFATHEEDEEFDLEEDNGDKGAVDADVGELNSNQ